jgi:hypothetical protein
MRSRTMPGQCLSNKIDWSPYKWDYLCGLRDESVCKFFVEGDEMPNVNIAIVLLQKDILADLVSARMLGVSFVVAKKYYL